MVIDMKNSKAKPKHRMTARRSATVFIGGHVMPAKGRTVNIPGLYSMYRAEVSRFRKPVSKYRFLKILDRNGYRRIGGACNGLLLDLMIV